jgi:hypothetical protein
MWITLIVSFTTFVYSLADLSLDSRERKGSQMSKSEVLRIVRNIATLTDLKSALQQAFIRGVHDSDVVLFNKQGEPLTLRVIEDTLTDGSKVINYAIE